MLMQECPSSWNCFRVHQPHWFPQVEKEVEDSKMGADLVWEFYLVAGYWIVFYTHVCLSYFQQFCVGKSYFPPGKEEEEECHNTTINLS